MINQWEEIEFNVCSLIGVYPQVVDQIIIFPDFNLSNRTQDNVIYIDNIGNNGSVSGIEELGSPFALSVYPNPSENSITVLGLNPTENVKSLEVINHMGQIVARENGDNVNIAVQGLKNGHYFLRISTSEREEILAFVR